MLVQKDICIVSDVHFAKLCFSKGFLVFEIRKNLDLRKILFTPKIFLKSRFHCITYLRTCLRIKRNPRKILRNPIKKILKNTCEGQVIKKVGKVFPDISVSIFAQALVVKSVHLK